jgi:hypothetical protein
VNAHVPLATHLFLLAVPALIAALVVVRHVFGRRRER